MDVTVQAMAGVLAVTGLPDGSPVKAGPAVSDFFGGIHMYGALVTALYRRATTGVASSVEVSMMSSVYPSLLSNIGLAEREGIVAAIDNLLLMRCIQLVRKIQYRSEKLDCFCNISSHTLGDDAFFGDFVEFLENNRELSKHLIFEFSQSDYEAWDSGAALYLRRLADLGCRFSLDGLHHLNVDATTLAARNFHFVKARADLLLSDVQAGETLVNAMKEHGLRMVVEKVEDEDALIEVMELGVDCAQGFLLGEPRLAKPAA